MNKIIIGVDQSYTDTGIAIAYNGKIMSVASYKMNKDKSKTVYRNELREKIDIIFNKMKTNSFHIGNCKVECIIERVRIRSSKPDKPVFLNFGYISNVGALNAIIIDVASLYDIPVYSADTRSWKSKVVGTSKPKSNEYGFPEEKYPTIEWCIKNGYEKFIKEEAGAKKKKGIIVENDKRYTYNDNKADSIAIALYGFKESAKLELEE